MSAIMASRVSQKSGGLSSEVYDTRTRGANLDHNKIKQFVVCLFFGLIHYNLIVLRRGKHSLTVWLRALLCSVV